MHIAQRRNTRRDGIRRRPARSAGVADDHLVTATDSDTVQITVNEEGTGGTGPFQEEGGTVVMEAENYDDNLTRSDPTDENWALGTNKTGYVGDGHMKSPYNHPHEYSTWANGAEINYDVDFTNAGTYIIWLRRHAEGSSSQNSCFVGLDGAEIGYFDNSNDGLSSWTWISYPSGNNEVYTTGSS